MRDISVKDIISAVRDLCIKSNCFLNKDVCQALKDAEQKEKSPIGKEILNQLIENASIAREKNMPICQDTGMAIFFIEIGQEVHIVDGFIGDAINEGVAIGYKDGYLRKSVVEDPFFRKNTGDNTPAIIHYEMVPGDKLKITIAPKGFGSENMSKIYMLKPSEGIEGAKKVILKTVEEAGPNPCPPMVVGIGIGGDFEKAAIMAKKALLRPLGIPSEIDYVKDLEEELLKKMNCLGIGPQGLGGRTTVLGVHIETYATHIAGLPVAVNISCHVTRHEEITL